MCTKMYPTWYILAESHVKHICATMMSSGNNFSKHRIKVEHELSRLAPTYHPRTVVPGDDDPFHFLSIRHQPDAILSESISLLLHLRSSVVFLKYDLSRKENSESRENLIIWLCHFSQQLWPCSEKFYFCSLRSFFGSFYLFSWNVSRMEEKIRFNWFMIVGGGDSQVPKIARLSSESLGMDFFGVIWSFTRSRHGRVSEKLTGNWRKSFEMAPIDYKCFFRWKD